MKKYISFIAGSVFTLVFVSLFIWPNSCSHQRTVAGNGTSSTGGALFLPHPAFASASGSGGVSIADIAERSMPSVVNISSTKVFHSEGEEVHGQLFNDPFFRKFFGERSPFSVPRERQERSLGSGVIVAKEGIVLTNNHVVEHAEKIRVTLSDKREMEAKIVGSDPKSDIAVLQLKGDMKNIVPLGFGDSNRLRMGDIVIAIGNPFGVGQTVTMGIVSAKGRANVGIVDYEDFIQTDAAINPGNSGGALINMAGELVGINTAILSRTGGYQGVGFAIPSNMARPIMESLTKHGKVVRGWLGVAIQDLNEDLAQALDLPDRKGVLISDVTEGSPASKAGVQRGDVVLRINGEVVDSTGRLRNLVAVAGSNAMVAVEVLRKGKRMTFQVKLGEMPATIGGVTRLEQGEGVLGGLTLTGLTPGIREKFSIPERVGNGVVVKSVEGNSPAASAGMRPGDVILEFNREPVKGVEQFEQLYHKAKGRVLLLIYRQGSTLFMILNK